LFYSVHALGSVGKVGSKGELFPPKEIRERLNLKPNTRVLYRENRGVLMVEPVPTLEELLSEPPVMEVTLEELRDLRSELSRRAEE